MDITITVSDETGQIIREKAEENGKNVDDFVGEFIEESFTNGGGEKRARKHNLLKFAGMFSGGDGTVSERYKQILLEEVDSISGFTTHKGEN